MFIDQIRLLIQAGSGGNGCESYYRRTDRKVIPCGGDGGKGGSILVRADTNSPPLANLRFKQHLIAESGSHGSSNRKRGKNGKDLLLLVPIGTKIYDRAKNLLIRELLHWGEEVVVLKGGEGGVGNHREREATHGEKGATLEIELNIRIVADIFLVGLPNSGKSKLLNRLARTHAKEEDYPFTTKGPEIGVYAVSDYEQLTLCELPSLYQASHEGRGMGSDFLKHLEHAKCIFHVLDPVSQFAQSLKEGLATLRKEIEIYRKDFLKIPYVVVVNKMDLEEAQAKTKKEKFDPGVAVFYISALTGEGMEKLGKYLKADFFEKAKASAS